MKMWNFPSNLVARLHQDENAFLLSTLLHIKEFSCLRHSSIADKENYIFPNLALAMPYVVMNKSAFHILFSLRDLKRRVNDMSLYFIIFRIIVFLYSNKPSKNKY